MTQPSNFFADNLSKDEKQRMDRQMRLPGWNQQALKEASVLIVGIGGLGTEIAKNLAMAGVGEMHLVDMDHIEYSNLNRQILFIDAKEGESKAKAAAKMLKRINPFGEYHAYHMPLQELDPEIYERVDLYIAGLDSVSAREDLNRRAVMNKKPLVDGGTATYHGHVYSYWPGRNSCLACDPMREPEREDLAACTLVGRPRKKSHTLLKGQLAYQEKHGVLPTVNEAEVRFVTEYANELMKEYFPHEPLFSLDDAFTAIDHHEPAIISINAVIASIQTQDALRLLHHLKGTLLGELPLKYVIYNGLSTTFYQFDKPRNPKCGVCGKNRLKSFALTVKKSSTFDMVLHQLRANGFKWDAEMPPLIYRMDSLDMEMIDLDDTLMDINARNKEIFLISGIERENYDKDSIYLQLKID
ncbi:MAG: HesA/MoeB/ThiF family protein [Candidatus Kariarchaeaceae archaeon]|jgi:molybdopterin/thiamine biosynthesis adenylyltransferase